MSEGAWSKPAREGSPRPTGAMCLKPALIQCTRKRQIASIDVDHVRQSAREVQIDLESMVLRAQLGSPALVDEPPMLNVVGLIRER